VSRPTLDDVFPRASGVRLSEVDEAPPDSGAAAPEAGELS